MITEDYVSFETAKLLKEKGFYGENRDWYNTEGFIEEIGVDDGIDSTAHEDIFNDVIPAPTLQMAMKWLRETYNVLVIPDYDYECTDESYCYKIYKLRENGKPERVPIEGVRYDMRGESYVDIVAYRDYKRSYSDYETYEEACEDGIRYVLENLI